MVKEKQYDAFISHASEDKTEVVLPLARALTAAGLRIWIDRFELTMGDSLSQKIDQGLSQSRFGIVVLSPSFFGKEWPQKELSALFALEEGGRKVILPVWHNVDRSKVAKFSPLMAARLAASWDDGSAVVVASILRVILDASTTESDETVPKSILPPHPASTGRRSDQGAQKPVLAITAAAVSGAAVFGVSSAALYFFLLALAGARVIEFETGTANRFVGPLGLAATLAVISPVSGFLLYRLHKYMDDEDSAAGCGCLMIVLLFFGAGFCSILAANYLFPETWSIRRDVPVGGLVALIFFLGLLSALLPLGAYAAFRGTLRWWSQGAPSS